MKKIRVAALALSLALAMALCALPAMAFAEGGNGGGNGGGTGSGTGNGDGSGTAGGSALPVLAESHPANGATISADESGDLWLKFSNNVADAEVAEANSALVHLQKADGSNVAAVVSVADTQVEPEARWSIFIKPNATLEPGAYVIVAEQGITAKNGQSSEEEFRVAFTVKGDESSASSVAASSNSSTSAPSSSAGASSASASSSSSAASSNSTSKANTNAGNQGISPIVLAAIAIAIVVICALVVVLLKRRGSAGNAANDADNK